MVERGRIYSRASEFSRAAREKRYQRAIDAISHRFDIPPDTIFAADVRRLLFMPSKDTETCAIPSNIKDQIVEYVRQTQQSLQTVGLAYNKRTVLEIIAIDMPRKI